MSRIDRFEDIRAWQKSRALTATIYQTSEAGKFARDFALRDQIRDAAISTQSNIAEGFERNRPREFHQFLSIAKASCAEVRSHLYTAFDVGHIDEEKLNSLMRQAEDVARDIGALRVSIERRHLQKSHSTQHSALSTQH
ncbi:MAG TPA: four helix bundle protein [Thermoanaerobaculia bacterium]